MEKLRRKFYRMEYKYGRYAIHNLMMYITITMVAVYILNFMIGVPIINMLFFSRVAIFAGQVWRIITFIFIPPMSTSLFLVALALYFNYSIGTTLENYWGAFKFNIYYLIGLIGAIIAGLISGFGDASYLNLSLFLAFAQLFPDTEFLLFFIIPIKAKYLGYFSMLLFVLAFFAGNFSTKMAILFSVLNFLLFFGKDFFDDIKYQINIYKNRRRFNKK